MSDWRELYSSALLETNPEYLELLLRKTEHAIHLRMQELILNPDGQNERRETYEALKNILNLKAEKLGWPKSVPVVLAQKSK